MLAGENTMRLICPNCGAQYEIDASLIPSAGRDVQCSNCGNTWFQAGKVPESTAEQRQIEDREHDPDYEPGGVASAPDAARDNAAGESAASSRAADDESVESGAEAPNEAIAEIVRESEEQSLEESIAAKGSELKFETLAAKLSQTRKEPSTEDQPAVEAGEDGPRKILASEVAEVLREEAERETRKRRHEAASLETQGELGIGDIGASDGKTVRATVAQQRMNERADAAKAEIARHSGSRRDDLPDIEKITSTLRANSEHAQPRGSDAVAQSAAVERKRGFRIGFLLVAIVVAALVGTYDYAPRIARQVPAARSSLANYVARINRGRIWLDKTFNAALGAITYRADKPGG